MHSFIIHTLKPIVQLAWHVDELVHAHGKFCLYVILFYVNIYIVTKAPLQKRRAYNTTSKTIILLNDNFTISLHMIHCPYKVKTNIMG